MNQAFFEEAMKIIENLTDEEIYEGLKKHGIEAYIRQYPEPKEDQVARRTTKQDRLDALSRINMAVCNLLSDINEVENETPGFTAPGGCTELAHEIHQLLMEAMKGK